MSQREEPDPPNLDYGSPRECKSNPPKRKGESTKEYVWVQGMPPYEKEPYVEIPGWKNPIMDE